MQLKILIMKRYNIKTRNCDIMNSKNENEPRISKNLISARANSLTPRYSGKSYFAASQTMSSITVALLIAACACISALAYGYDPEQQDGIPVFSARSVQRPTSSHDDEWSNNDSELMSAAPNQPMPAQRRQSDADLDDGLEDEEEDEYKSGSSPHESIESPSYGESRRFARDGDDIEEFFDRHLGPPQEAAVTAESSPDGSQYMVPASDPDDEDEYEAAASGPLATIFHSLLGHHDHKHSKRPFLQIATSSSADSSDSSSDADTPSGGKSGKGNLKASQSAQSYVEAAPFALALTPVAAPSTITVQEPAGQESQETGGGHEQEAPGNPGGVREIYIGRRPTVMSYLQQAQAVQQQAALPAYYSSGSANVWRGPNGRPMAYEQEQSANYARHPMAASQAYQREQPTGASSAASPVADDEQTVTYGLSFGGGGGSSEAKDETGADQEAADHPGDDAGAAEMPDAQQAGYAPYNTKYTTSSTRAHNNYYQQQYGPAPAGYMRVYPHQQSRYYHPQQMMMVQQQQQPSPQYQQQYAAGATRYHRDPSESTNHLAAMRAAHMGISYTGAQHRGLGEKTSAQTGTYGEQRRQLLASLDREIKASPQYRQNTAAAATALTNMYTRRPPLRRPSDMQHLVAFRAVKKSHLGDGDLDTFNSYHSEVDPYRTFTKTSRMINGGDPLALLANTRQAAVQSESRSQSQPVSHSLLTQSDALHQATNQEAHAVDANDNKSTSSPMPAGSIVHQNPSNTLLTGPLTNYDNQSIGNDLLRTTSQSMTPGIVISKDGQTLSGDETNTSNHGLSRVRRDDSEDREIDDDNDDDGVWVDDDGDDDNKQQSSDLDETSQEPEEEGEGEEEDGQQDAANNVPSAQQVTPPGIIGAPHGYELWPNDAMVYNG